MCHCEGLSGIPSQNCMFGIVAFILSNKDVDEGTSTGIGENIIGIGISAVEVQTQVLICVQT